MLSGYFVAFGPNLSQKLGNAGASPNYFLSSSYGRRALLQQVAPNAGIWLHRGKRVEVGLFNNNTRWSLFKIALTGY
ncbi:hypothetical protein IQ269_15965 [Tychonema sp. LEGE 07199]|uniref:hypothetical protein n=1 Tax=unclassified Tychonema TaxID=2642144 RepID=UPI0018810C6F|nr:MULTISPECIES: hypothetical protein [unclassified Tychonema]MBE9122259.1 hypothetical protein [Tychonema sp. LEGE 07199]MBE9134421.1 hypothetical protein [Tychonema sp. LEGE 07196]